MVVKRPLRWVVGVGLVLFACGCSGGSGRGSSSAGGESTTTAASQGTGQADGVTVTTGDLSVTVTTMPGVAPAELEEARGLVGDLGLAVSPEVSECIATQAASDGELSTSLREKEVGSVMTAASSCTQKLYAAPLFAENVNASLGGDLSEAQVACLADAYGSLALDDVADMSAGALNPGSGADVSKRILENLYKTCDVKGK